MKLIPRLVPPFLMLALQAGSLSAQNSVPMQGAPAQALSSSPQPLPSAAVEPGSEARIVRLSQVRGDVQLDRAIDRGLEPAFMNLPIVQKSRLKTGEGVAEVEFEDNSTLRLTPNTVVEFPRLRLLAGGSTITEIRVVQGMVYLSLTGAKGNDVSLSFADRKVVLNPSAHVELSVANPDTRIAVLDGTATLQDTAGVTSTLAKKHSFVFDNDAGAAPTLVSSVAKTPYDDWDKTATEYHKHYANAAAFGGASAGYGTSDLNYYGSFSNVAGCGQVWRPYLATAAWDPFASGSWAWYQGAGYSWVSPYPWAWAPFHTGSWQQCGANGWGWHPQGSWTGLNNREKLIPIHNPGHLRPPHEPLPGQPTLFATHSHPVAASGLSNTETFVFSKDSAGLGVPRETFGKLKTISSSVERHGVAYAPITTYATLAPSRSQRNGSAAPSLPTVHATGALSVASRGSVSTSPNVVSSSSSFHSTSASAPTSSSISSGSSRSFSSPSVSSGTASGAGAGATHR